MLELTAPSSVARTGISKADLTKKTFFCAFSQPFHMYLDKTARHESNGALSPNLIASLTFYALDLAKVEGGIISLQSFIECW